MSVDSEGDAKSHRRVLYLLYGDLLGNVFGSQLLPLWTRLNELNVNIQVLALIGPSVRWNRKWKELLLSRVAETPVPVEVSFVGAGFPPSWPKLCERKIIRTLMKFRPHTIHARGPIASGIAAHALSKRKDLQNVNLLYDVRGDVEAEVETSKRSLVHKYEEAAVLRADQIFSVSSPLSKLMKDRYGYKGPTQVIPCWGESIPDEDLTIDSKMRMRKALKILPNQFVWTYVGSAAPWQATGPMLSWFREMRAQDAKHLLLIVSDEPKEFEKIIAEKKLDPASVVLKSATKKETLRLLRSADAAILLRETNAINRVASPMKVSDYLSVGLPLLISDQVGDLSHWIRKERAGVVVEDLSVESVLTAAKRLEAQIQLLGANRVFEASRHLFLERFLVDSYLPLYLKAYGKDVLK